MKAWSRTRKHRQRDLSVGCRHHDGGLNGDVKVMNRSQRYFAKRALRQALNINNMV